MLPNPTNSHVVVTLVERDFLIGNAALFNSVWANGFRGRFIVGFRGWQGMPPLLRESMTNTKVEGCSIEWHKISTSTHFTNYKSIFLSDLLAGDEAIEKVTYLDPDVVSACPWSWMNSWCDNGPTMCADVNWWMPSKHPTRWAWKHVIRDEGFSSQRDLDLYINGGFLSLHRRDASFLQHWQVFTDVALRSEASFPTTGDIGAWRSGGREKRFHTPDQDALNMAAMTWENEISLFGPDAMGFCPGILLLPHALGASKPWRRRYLSEALRGRPPRVVDKVFWANALSPIPVTSAAVVRGKQMAISLAAVLGRFYRRS
jgi:hypothetical protein